MKKLNWKPWQIILSAIAGVAVIGGGAAGIWYGVSSADNDLPEEPSVMVTETAIAEPALDEPTATDAETETERETMAPKQTEKEPDTVIVYVTQSTEEAIAWEFDPALSEEVSRLMNKKFPNAIWDPDITTPAGPRNYIRDNRIVETNDSGGFTGKAGNNTAAEIVEAWSACNLRNNERYNILVYRYTGPGEGYIFTAIRHR